MNANRLMSYWIGCLVICFVFSSFAAAGPVKKLKKTVSKKVGFGKKKDRTVKETNVNQGLTPEDESIEKSIDRSIDRSFYVMLRILYKMNNKQASSECAGMLVDDDIVLTAARCFLNQTNLEGNVDSFRNSDVLDLTRVYVIVGDFHLGGDLQVPIEAEYVDVGNHIKKKSSVDVARVKLTVSATQEWTRKSIVTSSNCNNCFAVKPLKLCESSSVNRNSHVYIAGLACNHDEKKNIPTKWQEIEMAMTITEKNCKYLHRSGSRNVGLKCAVGINMLPKVEYKPGNSKTNKYDSFEDICENRGGPVFVGSDNGVALCSVGIVNGVVIKQLQETTKHDWFEGIKFTPVEAFYTWVTAFERVYNFQVSNQRDRSHSYVNNAFSIDDLRSTEPTAEPNLVEIK